MTSFLLAVPPGSSVFKRKRLQVGVLVAALGTGACTVGSGTVGDSVSLSCVAPSQ